jgi:hypothetical protein
MEIQLYKSQPYSSIAENKVAMSLHLHRVQQADMLECRLEILLIVPHLNKPAHLSMQTHKRG